MSSFPHDPRNMTDKNKTPFYQKPEWADVVPLPQDDGPNPLVPIAYSPEYSKTMGYFRAITKNEEISERALELTQIAIELSPANYTIWHYRQKLLKALDKDIEEELDWIEIMADEHPKSYQIWHHRQTMIEHYSVKFFQGLPEHYQEAFSTTASLLTRTPTIPYEQLPRSTQEFIYGIVQRELEATAVAFLTDSKNYHAWSYRQWVLRHFGAGSWWEEEFDYIDELLTMDIRNNSAWNERFYAVTNGPQGLSDEVIEREISYAKNKIERTPNNESPWSYLSGILKKAKVPYSDIKPFCEGLLSLPRANFSPYLHSALLDIYEEEAKALKTVESVNKAKEEAIILAERLDTIRVKYWNWRKDRLKEIELVDE
ncbi:hypothetical protein BGW38_007010 [Lunasporangiospora selenospora]|uniref:Protein farnesyltransferase/geranylgeranyltransferase type-1 subunit alpha n=1 Tax=Lunasporangiospora selenospora TaxID=979761 RepID=A0A9P6G0S5_9FUNG|nr:hypothetical protein BGW38_007010 [Lunasporangiospora selenospora]